MHKRRNYHANSNRCIKCGEPLRRTNMQSCLTDYKPQKMLCINCNAVNSVVNRLRQHKPITKEECERLPGFLRFKGEDEYYGLLFRWWIRVLKSR